MKKALTLVELLIAIAVMGFTLTVLLGAYSSMIFLGEFSGVQARTMESLQSQLEVLKNSGYNNLATANGTTFNISGISAGNARGVVFVRDVSGFTNLREVRVVASVRVNNRVIGEDANLNGTLESSEDTNSNNRLDSPFELVTFITK